MVKTILSAAIIFSTLRLTAQITPDSLHHQLQKHCENHPQEKIYIHLDKAYYSPGDTIWFKTYITEANTHSADTVSKVIHVDLFRKSSGALIRQIMNRNLGGYAHGYLALSDTLAEGIYEMRGYTNWMRNSPDQLWFHRDIFIRKRTGTLAIPNKDEVASWGEVVDLQFFPEGGNCIVGLQNRIAFKAVNKYGSGIDFKARIVSDQGDTIAVIQSQHLGMGSFVMTPKDGVRYYALIDKAKNRSIYLPTALPQGYTLFVDNLIGKEKIKIIARNNFPVKDRPIVIVQQQGNVVYAFQSETEGNSFSWSLPKSNIPDDGVVQITLFNKLGVPQCERLIYNNTNDDLDLQLAPDKQHYQPREKVSVSISVKDKSGSPIKGNFSLAVTDVNQVFPEKYGVDIYNYFYLSSNIGSMLKEVKGTVEQPGYYFDKTNANAVLHLDALLMTQGWRRFLWKDILSNEKTMSEPYAMETGITLKGKVKQLTGKAPSKPVEVSLTYDTNDSKELLNTKTAADGQFTFMNIEPAEGKSAFIQAKRKDIREFNVVIDSIEVPKFLALNGTFDPFFINAETRSHYLAKQAQYERQDSILRISKVKLLDEVVVIEKKLKQDKRRFMYDGIPNIVTIKSSVGTATATDIYQMIQGRVAGVQVSNTVYGPTITVRANTSFLNPQLPTFLVDGMVVDQSFLSTITPSQVEQIDIVKHGVAIYNSNSLISILTKAGNPNYDPRKDPSPGTLITRLKGYQLPREFYSPKYEGVADHPAADFRSTLYWNPIVITDENGNANVTFWNSNERTEMHLQLEGLSTDGQPAVATYKYTVE